MSWSSRYPLIRLLPIKIKKEKKKKHTFLYKVQAQVFFKFFFKNGKNLSISIPSFVPLIFYSRSSDTRYFKSNHELGSAPGRADKKEKKERVCSRPLPVSGHSEKSHSVHRSQRVRLRPCLLPVRFSFPCIPSASMTTKNQRLFGRFDASTRIVAIPQNSFLRPFRWREWNRSIPSSFTLISSALLSASNTRDWFSVFTKQFSRDVVW